MTGDMHASHRTGVVASQQEQVAEAMSHRNNTKPCTCIRSLVHAHAQGVLTQVMAMEVT